LKRQMSKGISGDEVRLMLSVKGVTL
jgi:hypothetical protein